LRRFPFPPFGFYQRFPSRPVNSQYPPPAASYFSWDFSSPPMTELPFRTHQKIPLTKLPEHFFVRPTLFLSFGDNEVGSLECSSDPDCPGPPHIISFPPADLLPHYGGISHLTLTPLRFLIWVILLFYSIRSFSSSAPNRFEYTPPFFSLVIIRCL